MSVLKSFVIKILSWLGILRKFKLDAELRFWKLWDREIREKGYWNEDTLEESGGQIGTYDEQRWREARGQLRRILHELEIGDPCLFDNKIVVEIGPGCVGMLEACNARIKIAIEPLAQVFYREGLLLDNGNVIYLSVNAEHIPLNDALADFVVSRNALDHVDNLEQVAQEITRILKSGGHFLLIVDIAHQSHLLEPQAITENWLDTAFTGCVIEHKRIVEHIPSHGQRLTRQARYIYRRM